MPQLELVRQPCQPLFGGAMTIQLPCTCRDTSAIQPLPDTREQFYSPELKMTFVVDLMVSLQTDMQQSLSTYLRDIDLCSDSQTDVLGTYQQEGMFCLHGITRGERTGYIELSLQRREDVGTDFLVYSFYYDEAQAPLLLQAAGSLTLLDRSLFAQ